MNVIVGVGGSDRSFGALDETIERAQEAGDALTIAVFDSETVDASPAEVEAEVRERLAAADFDAELRRLSGDPGPALVEAADGEAFDRIVLGSGERSALGKVQLGAVVEFVLLNARTPVTLLR